MQVRVRTAEAAVAAARAAAAAGAGGGAGTGMRSRCLELLNLHPRSEGTPLSYCCCAAPRWCTAALLRSCRPALLRCGVAVLLPPCVTAWRCAHSHSWIRHRPLVSPSACRFCACFRQGVLMKRAVPYLCSPEATRQQAESVISNGLRRWCKCTAVSLAPLAYSPWRSGMRVAVMLR